MPEKVVNIGIISREPSVFWKSRFARSDERPPTNPERPFICWNEYPFIRDGTVASRAGGNGRPRNEGKLPGVFGRRPGSIFGPAGGAARWCCIAPFGARDSRRSRRERVMPSGRRTVVARFSGTGRNSPARCGKGPGVAAPPPFRPKTRPSASIPCGFRVFPGNSSRRTRARVRLPRIRLPFRTRFVRRSHRQIGRSGEWAWNPI